MSDIDSTNIDFKIAQPDSLYLIGSNSIDTAGDLYLIDINAISRPENIRNKRIFDIAVALVGFLTLPLLIWSFSRKKDYLKNLINLFTGKKTCVGYITTVAINELPKIKKGVLTATIEATQTSENQLNKLNLIYARDYSVQKDLHLLLKNWKKMDQPN